MYEAIADPYCYPGTDVLKNIPGLVNAVALTNFEAIATAQRAEEPLPAGRLSVSHLRAIHHHLFQDVYPWAGRFRTVRMTKGSSTFCYPENIDVEMKRLFLWLREKNFLRGLSGEEFSSGAAHFLAELNAVHPFRDGNGRVQNAFLFIIATKADHAINFSKLDHSDFIRAMIRSFDGDENTLTKQIQFLIDAD
jgi:cell filamentation protein